MSNSKALMELDTLLGAWLDKLASECKNAIRGPNAVKDPVRIAVSELRSAAASARSGTWRNMVVAKKASHLFENQTAIPLRDILDFIDESGILPDKATLTSYHVKYQDSEALELTYWTDVRERWNKMPRHQIDMFDKQAGDFIDNYVKGCQGAKPLPEGWLLAVSILQEAANAARRGLWRTTLE